MLKTKMYFPDNRNFRDYPNKSARTRLKDYPIYEANPMRLPLDSLFSGTYHMVDVLSLRDISIGYIMDYEAHLLDGDVKGTCVLKRDEQGKLVHVNLSPNEIVDLLKKINYSDIPSVSPDVASENIPEVIDGHFGSLGSDMFIEAMRKRTIDFGDIYVLVDYRKGIESENWLDSVLFIKPKRVLENLNGQVCVAKYIVSSSTIFTNDASLNMKTHIEFLKYLLELNRLRTKSQYADDTNLIGRTSEVKIDMCDSYYRKAWNLVFIPVSGDQKQLFDSLKVYENDGTAEFAIFKNNLESDGITPLEILINGITEKSDIHMDNGTVISTKQSEKHF